MRALFQMTDKEIEDMTLDELRIERRVHNWSAKKMRTNIYLLTKKKNWLEANALPYTTASLKEQFERGEIPQRVYANRCSVVGRRILDEKATAMCLLYAKELEQHERSVTAILDEYIDRAKKKKNQRKCGPKKIDPRRNRSRNNPQRDWREMHPVMKKQKPLKPHNKYWLSVQENERSAEAALKRKAPIVTWDYEKLRAAARAAGFYTDEMIRVAVARELEVTTAIAAKLLKSGKLTWGQTMLIGGLFEMEPAVFCDVFLSGYFKEIADGRYIAQVDNKEALRVDK